MRKICLLGAPEMLHLLLLVQLVESGKRMKATEWLHPAAQCQLKVGLGFIEFRSTLSLRNQAAELRTTQPRIMNRFSLIYASIYAWYVYLLLFVFQVLPNSRVSAKEIYFGFTDSARVVFDHHSNRQFKRENNTGLVSTA
jgi:hypothetical protein